MFGNISFGEVKKIINPITVTNTAIKFTNMDFFAKNLISPIFLISFIYVFVVILIIPACDPVPVVYGFYIFVKSCYLLYSGCMVIRLRHQKLLRGYPSLVEIFFLYIQPFFL